MLADPDKGWIAPVYRQAAYRAADTAVIDK